MACRLEIHFEAGFLGLTLTQGGLRHLHLDLCIVVFRLQAARLNLGL